MKKKERQKKLAELMTTYEITRQEDFVTYLVKEGISVTQATISRDIKELHLIKVPGSKQGYRYSLPKVVKPKEAMLKLKKILGTSLINSDRKEAFVALKTQPGTAFALRSLLEEVFSGELFTLLADDNHLLLIANTTEDAKKIQEQLNLWIS